MADPRETFGIEVSKAILAAGMTQGEVARELGVVQQAVSSWMLGKSIPDVDVLRELAGLVGVDPGAWEALKLEALASGRGRARRTKKRDYERLAQVAAATDDVSEPAALSGKIAQLSDEDREYVESLVDRLLGEGGER